TITIADGDKQTGLTGAALPKALQVFVNGRAGIGASGLTVNFAITSGAGTLSAASAVTDTTGNASVNLTLGAAAGNVVVTATLAGSNLPAVQFTETANPANPNCTIGAPTITSVRSLSDFGGGATFGTGSWLEIKGTNLGTTSRLWAGTDFQGSNAPTALDGSSVSINGNAAFVEYVSPGQINVQA